MCPSGVSYRGMVTRSPVQTLSALRPKRRGPATRFPGKSRVPFSLNLTPALREQLRRTADRLGIKRGDVICELLQQHADELTVTPLHAPPRRGTTTRFPGKSRVPFALNLPQDLRTTLRRTADRLKIRRGDALCELIQQYADRLTLAAEPVASADAGDAAAAPQGG
jgi:CxxC motif-containing protein